jgi:autotransporter-associated beta strand protein
MADGAGAHADFSQAHTTSASFRVVNINLSLTLGKLTLGDTIGSNRAAWQVNATGGGALTFDNNGAAASLFLGPGNSAASRGVEINVPIFLNDSLDILANAAGAAPTITGAISASQTGTKTIANKGAGPLSVSLAGAISDGLGVVSLVQDSITSNLTLSGNNTYSGGTLIKAGAITISSDARLGAASGAVAFSGGTLTFASSATDVTSNRVTTAGGDGATFQLNGDSHVDWQGAIAGAGALTKQGPGTLVLTGSNNYSGGTAIESGTLKGHSRGLQGAIVNNAALVFEQDFSGAYAGALSGAGSLVKLGAGGLTLLGANSAFTGTTTVSAGGLHLGGAGAALGGNVVVSGATLGGAGVLGAGVTAAAASIIRVGLDDPATTGAQTLSVAGALSLENTRLDFDLFNDGSAASSDQLNAGSLVDNGGNSIYIGLFKSGTFTLGDNLGALWNTATLFVDGAVYQPGGRRTAILSAAGGSLQIEANAGASLALTWTGSTNSVWAATGSNWAGVSDGLFVNGDRVAFDDSIGTPAGRQVAVDGGGVVVSDMVVEGAGDYLFSGGGILANHAQAEGALASSGSSKLIKRNSGTLALHNGANDFKGGVDLHAGVLALGAGVTLGSGTIAVLADHVVVQADGAITLANGFNLSTHGLLLATQGNDVALSGVISGAGILTKTGLGALTLSGSNTHGGVALDAGTLIAGHAAALGSAVTINGTGVSLALNTTGTVNTAINLGAHGVSLAGNSPAVTLAGALAGSGVLQKTGGGAITLTGNNSSFTGAITVDEGALYFAETAALGAGSGAIAIAATGTLGLAQPVSAAADIVFDRALNGGGVFSISLGAADKTFRFGTGAASAFAGTVAMGDGIMKLDTTTVAELANARLVLGASSLADVLVSGTLGSLRLDGGTLKIGMSGGAPTSLLTVAALDVVSGTVAADVPALSTGDIVNPPVPPNPGLFDFDMATDTQLLAATSVTGIGTSLALTQFDGTPLASSATANVTQSGVTVAKAGYNYTAVVTGSGIYLASGIVKLDVLGGQSLILSNSGAPKSVLQAQITGAGGIDVRATGTITLANPGNDFTGATAVSAGTLLVTEADALAASSALRIEAGAVFDTGGFNQAVNNLSGSGAISLGAGTLTVNSGTDAEFSGSINAGTGSRLVKTGAGVLTLGGANQNAALAITQGRVRATAAGAIGTGAVTLADGAALVFTGVSGVVNNPLAGANAAVEFLAGSEVRLGGANTLSQVNIRDGSRVTATGSGALGGAAANVFVDAVSTLEAASAGVRAGNLTVDGGAITFAVANGGLGSLAVTGTTSFANGAGLRIDGIAPGGVYTVLQSGTIVGDFVYDRIQNGVVIDFARTEAGSVQLTALNQSVEPAKDVAMILDTIFAVRDTLSARTGDALLLPLAERGRGAPSNDFWINGVMAESNYDTTADHIGQDVDVHGVLVGYDRVVRGGAGLLGFYGGIASGGSVTDNYAHSDTDTQTVGIYGTAKLDPFYISADVSFGWMNTTAHRGEGAGTVKSDYDGDYQSIGLEAGFVWKAGRHTLLRPSVGIQGVSMRQDERVETGDGAMRVDAFRHNTVQGLAGVRGTQRFTLWGHACAFDINAGCRFDVSTDNGTVDAVFAADATGRRFALRTSGYAKGTAALVGAGFRIALWDDVLAGLSYGWEGGDGLDRRQFSASLRWLW